jgi:chromosome segregation ATPase
VSRKDLTAADAAFNKGRKEFRTTSMALVRATIHVPATKQQVVEIAQNSANSAAVMAVQHVMKIADQVRIPEQHAQNARTQYEQLKDDIHAVLVLHTTTPQQAGRRAKEILAKAKVWLRKAAKATCSLDIGPELTSLQLEQASEANSISILQAWFDKFGRALEQGQQLETEAGVARQAVAELVNDTRQQMERERDQNKQRAEDNAKRQADRDAALAVAAQAQREADVAKQQATAASRELYMSTLREQTLRDRLSQVNQSLIDEQLAAEASERAARQARGAAAALNSLQEKLRTAGEAQRQVAGLRESLEAKQRDEESARGQLAAAEASLHTARKSIAEVQARVASLQDELTAEQNRRSAADRLVRETQSALAQMQQGVAAQHAVANAASRAAEDATIVKAAIEQQLEIAQRRLNELDAQHSNARADWQKQLVGQQSEAAQQVAVVTAAAEAISQRLTEAESELRQKAEKLESAKAALQLGNKGRQNLEAKKGSLQQQLAQVTLEYGLAFGNVCDLRKRLAEQATALEGVQERATIAEAAVTTWDMNIASLQARLAVKQAEVAANKKFEKQLADEQARYAQLNVQFRNIEANRQHLLEQQGVAEVEAAAAKAATANLRQQLSLVQFELEHVKQERNKQTQNLQRQLQEKVTAHEAALQGAQAKERNANAVVETLRNDLASQATALQDVQAREMNAAAALASRHQNNLASQAAIYEQARRKDEANRAEVADLKAQIAKLQSQTDANRRTRNDLNEQLAKGRAASEAKVKLDMDKMKALDAQLMTSSQEMQEIQRRLTAATQKQDELQAQLAEQAASKHSVSQQLQELHELSTANKSRLQKQVDNSNKKLKDANRQVAFLQTQLDHLREQQAAWEKTNTQLRDDVNKNLLKISSLETQEARRKEEEANAILTKLSADPSIRRDDAWRRDFYQKATKAKQEAVQRARQQERESLKGTISTLRRQLGDERRHLQEALGNAGTARSRADVLLQQVGILQAQVTEQQGSLAGRESTIRNMMTHIQLTEAELRNTAQRREQEVRALHNEILGLQAAEAELRSLAATREQEVHTLHNQILALQAANAQLAADAGRQDQLQQLLNQSQQAAETFEAAAATARAAQVAAESTAATARDKVQAEKERVVRLENQIAGLLVQVTQLQAVNADAVIQATQYETQITELNRQLDDSKAEVLLLTKAKEETTESYRSLFTTCEAVKTQVRDLEFKLKREQLKFNKASRALEKEKEGRQKSNARIAELQQKAYENKRIWVAAAQEKRMLEDLLGFEESNLEHLQQLLQGHKTLASLLRTQDAKRQAAENQAVKNKEAHEKALSNLRQQANSNRADLNQQVLEKTMAVQEITQALNSTTETLTERDETIKSLTTRLASVEETARLAAEAAARAQQAAMAQVETVTCTLPNTQAAVDAQQALEPTLAAAEEQNKSLGAERKRKRNAAEQRVMDIAQSQPDSQGKILDAIDDFQGYELALFRRDAAQVLMDLTSIHVQVRGHRILVNGIIVEDAMLPILSDAFLFPDMKVKSVEHQKRKLKQNPQLCRQRLVDEFIKHLDETRQGYQGYIDATMYSADRLLTVSHHFKSKLLNQLKEVAQTIQQARQAGFLLPPRKKSTGLSS